MAQVINSEQMLSLIFEYTAKITHEKNLNRLLQLMADMGRDMIVADRCALWVLDKNSGEVWTRVAHGVSNLRMSSDAGLVGHSIHKGESILIDDAYLDPRFNQEIDWSTGYRTKAMLVIPLRNNDGDVIGAYQAINKCGPTETFSKQDLEYLTLAASYAGKSLEAALLNIEIEETQKEIIFTMGEIAEGRSKETGNHVKRVAEYSKLLACRYGMSQEEAELLRIASPMHDIGKIAIPDAILMKNGKLTDDEFEIMKTHTDIGYQLLRNSNRRILKAAAIIAHQHHEKWNGSGYPNGLRAEEIHLYARITAIADVFDALGSERVYKTAWDLPRILDLFRQERGQHFDPDLVDLFFESLDDILRIREGYKDF